MKYHNHVPISKAQVGSYRIITCHNPLQDFPAIRTNRGEVQPVVTRTQLHPAPAPSCPSTHWAPSLGRTRSPGQCLRWFGCSVKGYMGKFCHCCCGSMVVLLLRQTWEKAMAKLLVPWQVPSFAFWHTTSRRAWNQRTRMGPGYPAFVDWVGGGGPNEYW